MRATQAGLFDLPDPESAPATERTRGGRNRETWTRTATADVTIVDGQALREAAALAAESSVSIGLEHDPHQAKPPSVGDSEIGGTGPPPGTSAFDSLTRLIWPTDGMEGPLEVGAFRVLSANIEVSSTSAERFRLTWTVTVKLTDVAAMRRLATKAHPAGAALIAHDLAVAWQYAADPFAPVRSIPGMAWRPGPVEVQHLPRRG